ncbi:MAG: hypothetical protein ACTSR8_15130 [Promethearchaeota archaeon]
MISRIFIIAPGGKLCYFRNFTNDPDTDKDIVSGFLSAFNDLAKEITAGAMRKFSFRNFDYIYEIDEEFDCMFVMVIDAYDLEEDAREKLRILKNEFLKRYGEIIAKWDGNITRFKPFNEFIENNIFITPKILLTGAENTGKTTIMNLFPGELVINVDIDFNEISEKRIIVSGFKTVKEFKLREVDLQDLIYKPNQYGAALKSADIICIVINSIGRELGRINRSILKLKELETKADFYIIANFQDLEAAFEPKKIEETFAIKTYPLSAIHHDAKNQIFAIMADILKNTFADKELKMLKNLLRN